MGSITSYSKQVVVFFLALSLFIRPAFASSVGGWTMGNPIAQGASTIYEGSKNVIINGADYVKNGTAKITPTAANVAKTLGKGVAGVAVSVVIDELFDAADWVLDPANNQIKYNIPRDPTDITDPTKPYLFSCRPNGQLVADRWATSPSASCSMLEDILIGAGYSMSVSCSTQKNCTITYTNNRTGNISTDSANIASVANPAYDPTAEDDSEKSIPLDVVAQQVISNAEAGDTNAQVATVAAAADIVAEAETDSTKARPIAQQLEATSTTKPADADAAATANTATGTQTQNPTKPEVKDIALEFPAFCAWAPTLCEFAQTANQFIADIKAEYADKPQENTDTKLEIPDAEQDIQVDTDISFGGSCPATLTSQVNFMGINETIEFSFEPVCEIAEFIKPVVISVSAFSAVLIVAGIRTEDD